LGSRVKTTQPVRYTPNGRLTTAYYNFHGLFCLAVRATKPHVIAHFDAEYGRFKTEPLEVDLDLSVGPFSVNPDASSVRFDHFSLVDGWVTGHQRYKVASWRFAMTAPADPTTRLLFDGGMFSLDFLQHHFVEPLLRYKIGPRNVTLLGGGSVVRDNHAVLFSGLGHTGKTAVAIRQVHNGWSFQSDDMTFVSADRRALSYPRRLHVTDHMFAVCPAPMRQLQLAPKLSIKIKKLIYEGTLRYGELQESLRIDDLVPSARIVDNVNLAAVLILTASPGAQLAEPRRLNQSQLLDRLMAINGFEGRAFTDLLWACHAAGKACSPADWWQLERSIVSRAVADVPGFELLVPAAADRHAVLEHTGRVLEDLWLAASSRAPEQPRQTAPIAQPGAFVA
jgi:hypothetical protein